MSPSVCSSLRPLLACVVATQGHAQAPSLDRLELSAQRIIAEVTCGSAVASARERGAFGPADSLGPSFLCARTSRPRLGANFAMKPPRFEASAVRIVDLDAGVRELAPFDTNAISRRLDAMRLGMRACDSRRAAVSPSVQSVPIGILTEGDTLEVWFVPMSQFSGASGWLPGSVGGECGVIVSPDGHDVVRTFDAVARWRQWRDTTPGMALIESSEEDIPLLSEVLAGAQLAALQRSVAIQTKRWIFTRAGPVWITVSRR